MKMKEGNMAGRRKWALLLGGIVAAAAFLWGCLNPASGSVSVPEAEGKGGKIAGGGNSGKESFTVTVLAEGGPGVPASRAATGPDAGNIQLDGIRNIMQLIVADGAGNIAGFDQALKGDGAASLKVSLMAGGTYHFLLLQGRESGEGDPPTLLAAGFSSLAVKSGTNKVDITMRPLVTDTAFVPAAGSGLKRVEAYTRETAHLVPAAGGWDLSWAISSTEASDGTRATGFEPLLAAVKAADPLAGGPWYAAKKQVLDGIAAESPALSVIGDLVSLHLNPSPDPAAKRANFNLEYVPFKLREPAGGDGGPNPWAGYNGGHEPVWVIRNGLNDEAQDPSTDYKTMGDDPLKNGNGALNYKVLALDDDTDGDGIPAGDEVKWGLDPALKNTDSDGDTFSDKMETDNGFDPLDKEDNPGRAYPGSLAVMQGKESGPQRGAADTEARIDFSTGGYAGEAKGYYKAVEAGGPAPAYSLYVPFAGPDLGPAAHTNMAVSLPAGKPGTAACDVYVVIMHGRNVSLPLRISLPEIVDTDVDGGGW
jgi:hypothetical protein